ncbi:hypothetical protein [Labedaea rhizosphaerae]|uniref:Uncharacterized protein n=1 Tax=Labedaea rhizosphaerae TaxID=598644 RepID=A0A4R6SHH2_LABRH|nr:hypothetical protein [Labedaea rhizosphaerae]TDQ01255.1 hypothetical protein EV186_1021123 [Labedaea rhizosphaerae]
MDREELLRRVAGMQPWHQLAELDYYRSAAELGVTRTAAEQAVSAAIEMAASGDSRGGDVYGLALSLLTA